MPAPLTSVLTSLRAWQSQALCLLHDWREGPFLLSAAPGAGKTRPALELARALIERRALAGVVVLCPTLPSGTSAQTLARRSQPRWIASSSDVRDKRIGVATQQMPLLRRYQAMSMSLSTPSAEERSEPLTMSEWLRKTYATTRLSSRDAAVFRRRSLFDPLNLEFPRKKPQIAAFPTGWQVSRTSVRRSVV
jgi:hypothetical protein